MAAGNNIAVWILGDSSSYEKSLANSSKATSSFGSNVTKAAKVVSAAFIGGAVAAKIGFDELKEAEAISAQTTATLKATGGAANVTAGDIETLAGSLSRMSGVDDEVAATYAYTVDGSGAGELESETFCADTAYLTVTGADAHPGYAKGKMINALRVVADIIMALPQHRTPETTKGREGYLHPITVSGNVSEAKAQFLVRDFTEDGLSELEGTLRAAVAWVEHKYPGAKALVEVKQSYRNMKYVLDQHPHVRDYAEEAIRRGGGDSPRRPHAEARVGPRRNRRFAPHVHGRADAEPVRRQHELPREEVAPGGMSGKDLELGIIDVTHGSLQISLTDAFVIVVMVD